MSVEQKYILGIESSCDDTAAAIVDRDGQVLSSVISTQAEIHNAYGGVYPELASRAHVRSIVPTVNKALADASVSVDEVAAIGVTRGPGLIGSLLVGLNAAAGLGLGWQKPVIGVNHLRGHLRSADLEEKRVTFPAIVLLVSGGHTFLAYMRSATDVSMLGSTRDDSVGEAYDKVSRMLGLGYPGGPVVDRLAKTGAATIRFPRPMLKQGYEFSFSGLKSAVSRYVSETPDAVPEDIAASFVDSCMTLLVTKCDRAIAEYQPKSLVVVGGVSASPQLRQAVQELGTRHNILVSLPPVKWSTDNAAMIALATWDYIDSGIKPKAEPDLSLALADF